MKNQPLYIVVRAIGQKVMQTGISPSVSYSSERFRYRYHSLNQPCMISIGNERPLRGPLAEE